MNANNTTRILSIWDQSGQYDIDQTVPYGREYTSTDINRALNSDTPYEEVPNMDSEGHGTLMAALACGNIDEQNDFYGMAPLSSITVVKLKDAKPYLKSFYGVSQDVKAYQENDIMYAINYLEDVARKEGRPMIICIGVGTNMGDHDGKGLLENYIDIMAGFIGICVCTPAGNEVTAAHHYRDSITVNSAYKDVELRIGKNTKSFTMQLWTGGPNIVSVGFISPGGEVYEKIPARLNESRTVRFFLEPATIYIDYRIYAQGTGDELVEMRFFDPAPGVWIIRVYSEGVVDGLFDIWLPARNMIPEDTYFLRPDPQITIVEPSNASFAITSAGYNYRTSGLYIESSRGYTRSGQIKPDVTAPAVEVYGPSDGEYNYYNGTSVGNAITAGACALMMEWAIVKGNDVTMSGSVLRKYLIRGAKRSLSNVYPNPEWGYGILDIYGAFLSNIQYVID